MAQQLELDSPSLQKLYGRRGRALELAHRFEDALHNYEEMATHAEKQGDQPLLLASLMAQAILFATPSPLNDPAKGQLFSEEAIALAQTLGDRATEAKALWTMLLVHHYALGDEEKARDYGEAASGIARELKLTETLAYALNDLNWVYMTMGDFRQAQRCLQEAVELWRELHNIPMLIDGLNGSGILNSMMGEFDTAVAAAEEGAKLAKSIENTWNQIALKANLLWVYREKGQYDELIEILKAAVDLSQNTMPVVMLYYQTHLALIYTDLGAVDLARLLCDELLAQCETAPTFWQLPNMLDALQAWLALLQNDLPCAQSWLQKSGVMPDDVGIALATIITTPLRCEIALAQGDAEEALQFATAYHTALEAAGARLSIAESFYYQGRALLALGDQEKARHHFTHAYQEAKAIGSRRMRWRILDRLAHVSDGAQAQAYRQEARATLDSVLAHVPEGELRAAFLTLPQMKSLLH